MGDKFSWEKLLGRGKKSDHTIEIQTAQENVAPIAPVSPTAPVAPVLATGTSGVPIGSGPMDVVSPLASGQVPAGRGSDLGDGEADSGPKAPMVIDGDEYAGTGGSDFGGVGLGGSLETGGASGDSRGHFSGSSSAGAFWNQLGSETQQAISSSGVGFGGGVVGGGKAQDPVPVAGAWDDVDLTPAEKMRSSAGGFDSSILNGVAGGSEGLGQAGFGLPEGFSAAPPVQAGFAAPAELGGNPPMVDASEFGPIDLSCLEAGPEIVPVSAGPVWTEGLSTVSAEPLPAPTPVPMAPVTEPSPVPLAPVAGFAEPETAGSTSVEDSAIGASVVGDMVVGDMVAEAEAEAEDAGAPEFGGQVGVDVEARCQGAGDLAGPSLGSSDQVLDCGGDFNQVSGGDAEVAVEALSEEIAGAAGDGLDFVVASAPVTEWPGLEGQDLGSAGEVKPVFPDGEQELDGSESPSAAGSIWGRLLGSGAAGDPVGLSPLEERGFAPEGPMGNLVTAKSSGLSAGPVGEVADLVSEFGTPPHFEAVEASRGEAPAVSAEMPSMGAWAFGNAEQVPVFEEELEVPEMFREDVDYTVSNTSGSRFVDDADVESGTGGVVTEGLASTGTQGRALDADPVPDSVPAWGRVEGSATSWGLQSGVEGEVEAEVEVAAAAEVETEAQVEIEAEFEAGVEAEVEVEAEGQGEAEGLISADVVGGVAEPHSAWESEVLLAGEAVEVAPPPVWAEPCGEVVDFGVTSDEVVSEFWAEPGSGLEEFARVPDGAGETFVGVLEGRPVAEDCDAVVLPGAGTEAAEVQEMFCPESPEAEVVGVESGDVSAQGADGAQGPGEVMDAGEGEPDDSGMESEAAPLAAARPVESFEEMRAKDRKVGDLLLANRLITERQLERAIERQSETKEKLGHILISMQTLSERRLLQALAAQRGVSPWHLEDDAPSQDAVNLVPEEMCRMFQVLPVAVRGDLLIVAMRDTSDTSAIDAVRQWTRRRIEPVLADEARLAHAIDKAFGIAESRRLAAMDGLVSEALKGAEKARHLGTQGRALLSEEDTRPVVGLVNQLIEDGIRMRASDVHLEPRYDRIDVRYRLDGRLVKVRELPVELLGMLATRIKILAELDIVEYRMPQDGRITAEFGPHVVDLRVSVLPNYHGPRIVMRILDKSVGLKALGQLGFEAENLQIFRDLVSRPYGLFLVTGPTGSGKTTTLYAALNELKDVASNVMTCEDPVEYDLAGVNQSQVNEKVGLTFSHQLRAILRQDPDVILVGEIRDRETADTAIRAAMTGHMVLSTLHCNDAAGAVPRLLDMGVDPYLLSTVLTGTMSQRLLRTLCGSCKREEAPTAFERQFLHTYFGAREVGSVWRAVGCGECHDTGYKGRVAVHEILPVTEEVAQLIAERAPVEVMKSTAAHYGYLPMQQDALRRVLAGETTVEEAKRLLSFDTIERSAEARKLA